MRASSIILFCLCFLGAAAHEKHISTISILDGKEPGTVQVLLKIGQDDYLVCSKLTKADFAGWVSQHLVIYDGTAELPLSLVEAKWEHEICALFVVRLGNDASTVSVRSTLLNACMTNHKTIVAAQLGGHSYGKVLNAQSDTCAFPLRK